MGSGTYRPSHTGSEGKYFFPTKAQAENFSKMASNQYGTGPYCITSGCIPLSALAGRNRAGDLGTEGVVYVVPNELLPYFNNIMINEH